MNIEEFNEKFEVHIESSATTLGGLTSIEFQGNNKPLIDYLTLMDDQYNLSYTVFDSETMEEVFKVETESDTVAVERIMKEFDIKA